MLANLMDLSSTDFPINVLQLKKHSNGLKQASRAWFDKLSSFLIEHQLTKGIVDPTLFTRRHGGDILLVQVYVDDIIFGSINPDFSKRFVNHLKNNFEMSMISELKLFLGLQFHQSPRGIFISQSQYAIELLKKHGMDECVSMSKPMATERLEQTTYRRMIRGLMYLTASRPDIAFTTFVYARYQTRPTVKHLKEVKRIFRYLRKSYNMGLWYPKNSRFELIASSDADHARCKDDCQISLRGLQFLGEKLVSWSSKKQDCTVMSIAEAEYLSKLKLVKKGTVELYFIGTEYQLADLFTKALPKERFEYLVHRIGISILKVVSVLVKRLALEDTFNQLDIFLKLIKDSETEPSLPPRPLLHRIPIIKKGDMNYGHNDDAQSLWKAHKKKIWRKRSIKEDAKRIYVIICSSLFSTSIQLQLMMLKTCCNLMQMIGRKLTFDGSGYVTAGIKEVYEEDRKTIDLKPKMGSLLTNPKMNEKKTVAIEDSNSKALVATDNNEDIDWTKEFDAEPVTFAMIALTGVEQDDWSMEFDAEHVHFGQDGLGDFDWSNKDDDTPVSLALMLQNQKTRVPQAVLSRITDRKLLSMDGISRDLDSQVTHHPSSRAIQIEVLKDYAIVDSDAMELGSKRIIIPSGGIIVGAKKATEDEVCL
ncbi:retrovirus-related pol polyprotein from transposon TNT 1-94 [Tanacetum coccineum]